MAKRLQELTIIDNFMFGAVMSDPENCRLLLEMILEIPIERVVINTEKTLVYHPDFRGIRLDVYAKDENNTRYNVEMQVEKTPILKRSRYYHAQMDMKLISTGTDYTELPDTYVIFICNYDPLGMGKYRYDIKSMCIQNLDYPINDGIHTIILNNRGQNPEDISQELVNFLNFTKATLEESEEKSDDPYVTRIQQYIRRIKHDREKEEQYMLLELLLKESKKEGIEEGTAIGKAEGESIGTRKGISIAQKELLINFLSRLGEIPPNLSKDIQSLNNPEIMQTLIWEATQAASIQDFIKIFHQIKVTE